jgi:pimeloyl-ACP methyl ester carboxylesterase
MTDWELIEPSEDLHWVPCFRALDDFLCARLTVPMDYNRPLNQSTPFAKSHPKVHIALIMLPGKNHTESGAWSESPLLVNPGGPGGSGTEIVKSAGRAQQEIAGSDLDIVGFDPRGIGATTPQANCFLDPSVDTEAQSPYERRVSKEDALIRRVLWMTENAVVGLPNSSSTATEQTVFRARGLTKLCNFQDDQDSILRFAGTPNVAQDMLSIVQAWDKWSAGLGRKPERHQESSLETALPELDGANGVASPPSTRGKLVYWGFSYGTVLGATFATMFPEHVGRMVLDGVVNSDEWYFENVSSIDGSVKCTAPLLVTDVSLMLPELEECASRPGKGD